MFSISADLPDNFNITKSWNDMWILISIRPEKEVIKIEKDRYDQYI